MTDHASVHPDEARLLLYLAGELPPAQRREFEVRLASDPALRQQLETLQRLESGLNQSLCAADAAESINARLPVVERQVAKALSQWQVDRLNRNAPTLAQSRVRRVPVWMYPLSAAAIVMMCLGVWWLSLETLPNGMSEGPIPSSEVAPQNRGGFVGDPEGPFDLALNDLGSDTFNELERDMATFQTLNETLQ